MSKPTILITGASAGLGVAFAREYASHGWDLVLCARRRAPMEALASELKERFDTESYVFEADLFEKHGVDKLLTKVKVEEIQIDGLINNAGYGHPGKYLESEWEDHGSFIHLMATVPCELAHKLAPAMKKRGYGRIMNVASLAGHLPGSRGHTLYAAVKAFLIKFSESLNMEMEGTGVNVSAICPGFTMTEFHDVNGTRDAMNRLPEYMMMDAAECAEIAYEALERNRAVYITGRVNRFIAILGRLLPVTFTQKLMAKNSEKFRNIHD